MEKQQKLLDLVLEDLRNKIAALTLEEAVNKATIAILEEEVQKIQEQLQIEQSVSAELRTQLKELKEPVQCKMEFNE